MDEGDLKNRDFSMFKIIYIKWFNPNFRKEIEEYVD